VPKSMSRIAATASLAASLAAGALPAATAAEPAPALPDVLHVASRDGRFVPPSTSELERAEALFAVLAAGRMNADAAALAAALDLDIVRVANPDAWVVRELPAARRGRGLYAFRASPDGRDTLQVPHGFRDEMTREIGLALFAEGHFAAAAWNTVPRRYDEAGSTVDADMAHISATYFNAFTRAVARVRGSENIVQIHGFDQGKRKSAAAGAADLILSAGHRQPPQRLREKWQCLVRHAPLLGGAAALYPDSASELGGTTNAQLAALRDIGFDHFIHAEISRPLRLALRDDARRRAVLLDCLQGRR